MNSANWVSRRYQPNMEVKNQEAPAPFHIVSPYVSLKVNGGKKVRHTTMSFEPAVTEPSARAQKAEARRVKPVPADMKMMRKTALIFSAAMTKKRFKAPQAMRK